MKRALLTAALLLALPAAAVADEGAQQPPRPRDLAPEARLQQRMDRMAEFLKLTDAQKASIKALHERQQAGAKARHETVQAAAKAFREAVQDPKISTDQLRPPLRDSCTPPLDIAIYICLASRGSIRMECIFGPSGVPPCSSPM